MEWTGLHAPLLREGFRSSADLGSVTSLWTGSLVTGPKSELKTGIAAVYNTYFVF